MVCLELSFLLSGHFERGFVIHHFEKLLKSKIQINNTLRLSFYYKCSNWIFFLKNDFIFTSIYEFQYIYMIWKILNITKTGCCLS